MSAETISKQISLKSQPSNIVLIEPFIEEVRMRLNIADEMYGNILVCVTEAVNNAIIHGNKQDESKYVEVMMQQKADKLSVTVKDQGKGFDYSSVADPTEAANLCRCGGRGVFLMRQLSQNCKFSENGRVVNMEFDI